MNMSRKLLLAACLTLAACERQAPEAEVAKGEVAALLSGFAMADPQAAKQMTHGFYGLENGWRWVASNFGVTLAPPEGAATQLELQLVLPATVLERLGAVTLSATVNGTALAPATYKTSGSQVYTRDVGKVGPGPVNVEFSTDKALPPGEIDVRELALIVSHVGLIAK